MKISPARTDQERWAARALLTLSENDPDGASKINDVGFNKSDGDFGHSLAAFLQKTGGLTDKQWSSAIKLCRKYWRQVGVCPDDIAPAPKEDAETMAGEITSREADQAGRPRTEEGGR